MVEEYDKRHIMMLILFRTIGPDLHSFIDGVQVEIDASDTTIKTHKTLKHEPMN